MWPVILRNWGKSVTLHQSSVETADIPFVVVVVGVNPSCHVTCSSHDLSWCPLLSQESEAVLRAGTKQRVFVCMSYEIRELIEARLASEAQVNGMSCRQ